MVDVYDICRVQFQTPYCWRDIDWKFNNTRRGMHADLYLIVKLLNFFVS